MTDVCDKCDIVLCVFNLILIPTYTWKYTCIRSLNKRYMTAEDDNCFQENTSLWFIYCCIPECDLTGRGEGVRKDLNVVVKYEDNSESHDVKLDWGYVTICVQLCQTRLRIRDNVPNDIKVEWRYATMWSNDVKLCWVYETIRVMTSKYVGNIKRYAPDGAKLYLVNFNVRLSKLDIRQYTLGDVKHG